MLSNTRLDGKLRVSSLIAQSYSRYIGIEVPFQRFKHSSALFNYMRSLALGSASLPNQRAMQDTAGDLITKVY
jgi:hypothetical protein